MNATRIKWINGLKGIACMWVFLHHFALTFYKATLSGDPAESLTKSGIYAAMAYQPYGVIVNGNVPVCLFLIISAFLFAGKVIKLNMQEKEIDFLNICIKRYLRLMLNVAVIGITIYLINNIAALVAPGLQLLPFHLNFIQLILEVLFFQWIMPSANILGTLWTMEYFLLGAILAAFLGTWSTKKRWYMPFIYLFISFPLEYLLPHNFNIILGVILADIYYHNRMEQYFEFFKQKPLYLRFCESVIFKNIVGIVMILTGLFIGSYPSLATPVNPVHVFFMKVFGKLFPASSMTAIHGFSVFIMMAGLLMVTTHPILSSKLLNKLGEISMGVYLQHGLVIGLLGVKVIPSLLASFENYHLAVLVIFIITLVLTLVTAWLYHIIIEKWIDRIVKKIHL